jgi:CheY-like chemotaxis protein
MAILLAIQDHEVRTALRLLLEEEGCTVIPACDARLAVRVLTHRSEPVVAVLDAHLELDSDELAAEHLLELAAQGMPWAAHRYLVLTTVPLRRWAPRLAALAQAAHAPVLELPQDIGRLLAAVSLAQAPAGASSVRHAHTF